MCYSLFHCKQQSDKAEKHGAGSTGQGGSDCREG